MRSVSMRVFLGLMVLGMLGTSPALAQDLLEKAQKGVGEATHKSPGSIASGHGWVHPWINFASSMFINRVDPEAPSSWENLGGSPSTTNKVTITPGEKKHFVNMYGPMSGWVDTMNADVYYNMATKSLSSPLAVLNITWGLTEPGVATGMANATAMANQWVGHRYEAEQALVRQGEYFSEFGESVIRAYYACIHKKLQSGGSSSVGASWIEAMDKCMYDRDTAPATGGAGGGFFPAASTTAFSFADDYNAGSSSGSGDEITLWDYVFNQEMASGTTDLKKLKQELIDKVGNVKISLGGSSSASATMELTFIREVPTKKIEREEAELTYTVYEKIMDVLNKSCKHGTTGGSVGQVFNSNESFWEGGSGGSGGITADDYMVISILGGEFSASIGDPMKKMFLRKDIAGEAAQAAGCDKFIKVPTSQSEVASLAAAPEDMWVEERQVFSYAQHVAHGQILIRYMKAQEFIGRLTGGVFDNYVRDYALRLINETVGGEHADLHLEYMNNLKGLHNLRTKIIEEEAARSGRKGYGVVRPFVRGGDMNETSVSQEGLARDS